MLRRSFLTGLGALIAAPAIVRAESLMKLPAKRLLTHREIMQAIIDLTEKHIRPPYGLSPCMQALPFLEQWNDTHACIIRTSIPNAEWSKLLFDSPPLPAPRP